MFVFMLWTVGLELSLHFSVCVCVWVCVCVCVCVCTTKQWWGGGGFLDSCTRQQTDVGDLNLNCVVGQLQKATFPPVLLPIPRPFPHALASSSCFSFGLQAETWILTNSRRDVSMNLSHAGVSVCGSGDPAASSSSKSCLTLLYCLNFVTSPNSSNGKVFDNDFELMTCFSICKNATFFMLRFMETCAVKLYEVQHIFICFHGPRSPEFPESWFVVLSLKFYY